MPELEEKLPIKNTAHEKNASMRPLFKVYMKNLGPEKLG